MFFVLTGENSSALVPDLFPLNHRMLADHKMEYLLVVLCVIARLLDEGAPPTIRLLVFDSSS